MTTTPHQIRHRFRNLPAPVRQVLAQDIAWAKLNGNPIAADGLPRYGRAVLARRMALATVDMKPHFAAMTELRGGSVIPLNGDTRSPLGARRGGGL